MSDITELPQTETLNKVDTKKYNPEKKYYFLSATDYEHVCWIKYPLMTRGDINETLKDILEARYVDKETVQVRLKYGNIEIFSEDDTLNKKSKYSRTDGEYHELTLREAIFGDKYEKYYERIINKPEELDPHYIYEERRKKLYEKESSLGHTDD